MMLKNIYNVYVSFLLFSLSMIFDKFHTIEGVRLGFPSTIIRFLSDYIPSENEGKPCPLPYSELMFNHESPTYMCKLIKNLSAIRLYLYGNETHITKDWANEMIRSESSVMDDEDNWCAFVENESIRDNVKWNLAFTFARDWNVKKLTPLKIQSLYQNLRFYSALRRAHRTFPHREIEITAKAFHWYDDCIRQGYIQIPVNR